MITAPLLSIKELEKAFWSHIIYFLESWHDRSHHREMMCRFCMCVCSVAQRFWFSVTLWTVARQASLSLGFSRQEYWSEKKKKNTGEDCQALLQRIFPTQGWNPHLLCLLHWQAGSSPLSHQGGPCVDSILLLIYEYFTLVLDILFIQADLRGLQHRSQARFLSIWLLVCLLVAYLPSFSN